MICKTCFPKLSWEGFLPQEVLNIIKLILKCLNLGPSFSLCVFSIKLKQRNTKPTKTHHIKIVSLHRCHQTELCSIH